MKKINVKVDLKKRNKIEIQIEIKNTNYARAIQIKTIRQAVPTVYFN